MKKICTNCQYFREPGFVPTMPDDTFCSNSKSRYARQYVTGFDTCDQFYKRGKKAPVQLRMLNKAIGKVLEGLRK